MDISQARVLVVEDDEVMRNYVVNSLYRIGIQSVEVALDGESALRTMMVFRPHLILTDIHMQPMDGIAFVQHLRSHTDPVVRNTKVIFMSADARTTMLETAMPLGTFGYIVKPPRLETLQAKIEQALH